MKLTKTLAALGILGAALLAFASCKDSSGEGIHFSKQSGLWIVSLKDNNGKFVNLGKFKSEEEAIKAKNDFLNSL